MSILLRSSRGQQRDALEAALREAEQRGKPLDLDRDVELRAEFNRGCQSVIARLQNPDDATDWALTAAMRAVVPELNYIECRTLVGAIAAVLSSPAQEG
jgi:sugar/nucleoside kinase (ribokinase family)